jgi:class 3 adenylate cyclase
MLENSRRVEQDLLAAEGRRLTALAADLGDSAHVLPSGVRQDRRTRFRGEAHPLAELIVRHRGRPIRLVGQALLAVFDDPGDALAAARELRDRMPLLHPDAPALRAGLQTGPLLVAGAEVFGEAAGLAARLHGLAQPGEILLGADTLEALKGPLPPVSELEPQRVRGRQHPLRVYRLSGEKD